MNIKFEPITFDDLDFVKSLQPVDWNYDLSLVFKNYIESKISSPVKLIANDTPVGIGNLFLFEYSAWLSQIIVTESARGNGYGGLITRQLLDMAPSHIKTFQLIATDLGYPVYKKLGFEVMTEYLFYNNVSADNSINATYVKFEDKYKAELLSLDRHVTGENRSVLFTDEVLASMRLYFVNDKIAAYLTPDLGEGHILSVNEEMGLQIMNELIQKNKRIVFPKDNEVAANWLKVRGKYVSRTAKRMILGERLKVNLNCIYGRIGGNLG